MEKSKPACVCCLAISMKENNQVKKLPLSRIPCIPFFACIGNGYSITMHASETVLFSLQEKGV